MSGSLILLPNVLDEELSHEPFFPSNIGQIVQSLDGLIAESEKGSRRFLRRFVSHERMTGMPLKLLNEHTPPSELNALLDPVAAGEKWGLVSDAGLPCIADPGEPLVLLAHIRHLNVTAISGPTSPILALQLSGLNGQRFAFYGYLPREIPALQQMLIQLENRSRQEKATQLWIEAPYRSAKLAVIALEILHPATLFCIALSLTTPRQRIRTQSIAAWRKQTFFIEKEPAVFLLFTSS